MKNPSVCIRALAGLLAFAAANVGQAQLTREQAVAALLAPGSGVALDPDLSAVWSPFVDFGFGDGFEGLLPAGSTVSPRYAAAGAAMAVTVPSYFFWVDDAPPALFAHPVRFVLLEAGQPNPSLANGGIRLESHGWWPVVAPPDAAPLELFSRDLERSTDAPSGAGNPEGHIAGPVIPPIQLPPSVPSLQRLSAGGGGAATSNNACGLIVVGHDDLYFFIEGQRQQADLIQHHGLSSNRVQFVNQGLKATRQEVANAISNLCNLNPGCDKIFIRMNSHGTNGSFVLADGPISGQELCDLYAPLAAKGAPICSLIFSCYSASLVDPLRWNFPAGSTLLFSANTNRLTWGGPMLGHGPIGLYPFAFSECLNSDPGANPSADADDSGFIDDGEAHDWLVRQNPGFIPAFVGLTNFTLYPAGPATATNRDPELVARLLPDPQPRKFTVGTDPFATVLTVYNGTASNKTDFHIMYQGNVTNGLRTRSTRSMQDGTPTPQAGWTNAATVTYDPATDRTMVCWMDTNNPVPPGGYINVTVVDPRRRLRPQGQFWTPTDPPPPPPPPTPPPVPAADKDRAPAKRTSLLLVPDGEGFRVYVAPSQANDPPLESEWSWTPSPAPIPEDSFYPGSPPLIELEETPLGPYPVPAEGLEIPVPAPPPMPRAPLPTGILKSESSWLLNSNQTVELAQFVLPTPPQDTTELTQCPGGGVFMAVDLAGGSFQWYKDGQPIVGQTTDTLTLLNLNVPDSGMYTGLGTNLIEVKRKFFALSVVDLVAPTVNCPADISLTATSAQGALVNYGGGVSASDSCGAIDGSTFQCNPPPGLFPVGTTEVTCSVADTFGNVGRCAFTVTVSWPETDLAIGLEGGQAVLRWSDSNAVLQCAPAVTGPWDTIPAAASPYTVPLSPEMTETYFRLVFP